MITVTVIGKKDERDESLESIEFCKILDFETLVIIDNEEWTPGNFEHIELICLKYDKDAKFDLMFGYDNLTGRTGGILFLGHFNDGVVL